MLTTIVIAYILVGELRYRDFRVCLVFYVVCFYNSCIESQYYKNPVCLKINRSKATYLTEVHWKLITHSVHTQIDSTLVAITLQLLWCQYR